MHTDDVVLATPDGPMALSTARPDGAARGAVIVLQEAFGVNGHIRSICERLADAGYHAVAPHVYHRTGGGTVPYGDHDAIVSHVEGMDDTGILVDVDATFTHLTEAGWRPEQVGVVGFCMGGRMSFLAATQRSFGAAVGFYGGGIVTAPERFAAALPSLLPDAAHLATPWLGVFGDQDGSIPVADVEALRAALAQASVDWDVVRYAEAGHAFHCDARPEYRAPAAADAWARTLAWFDRHLEAAPRRAAAS